MVCAEAHKALIATDHAGTYARLCREKLTVLLVDDDPMYNSLVQSHLPDINIVTAQRCDEAIRYLKSHRVDGVILDVKLPDCDGLELIQDIRILSNAPCVVVTGADFDGERYRTAIRNGATGFMLKPDSFRDGSFVSSLTAFFNPNKT